MKVIKPRDIDLVSSTVSASTETAWDSGTTYAVGSIVLQEHKVYKSLQDANTGNSPADSPTWWSLQEVENRWAMFDSYISSQTDAGTNSMVVEVAFGGCDGFGLFNMDATQVVAEIRDSNDALQWSETINLIDSVKISNWFDYFFEPIEPVQDVVRSGLPIYNTSTLKLTITAPSGTVKVGHCSVGFSRALGLVRYGVETGVISYGRKDVDDFGNSYLKQGHFAKRSIVEGLLRNTEVDIVFKRLASLRETPSVWILDNKDKGYESLTVFGFWRDFAIEIPGPTVSSVSLEIEGLS